jgi:parallel beta-helix repeat protein
LRRALTRRNTAAERNIVSGNRIGVYWQSGASGNFVRGNYVGTNAAGTAAIANTCADW